MLHESSQQIGVHAPLRTERRLTVALPATGEFAVKVRAAIRRFGSATVLDGLHLDIAEGEFVALLGRSGSGKTTLLRALGGLDRLSSGTIEAPLAVLAPFAAADPIPPGVRQLRPPIVPRATTCAWISAAPSKMLRMRASHSTRLISYSSA